MRTLLPSRPVTADRRYYGSFRPCAPRRYAGPCDCLAWASPLASTRQARRRRGDRFQGSVLEPDPCSRRFKAGCHADRKQIPVGTAPRTHTVPRFRHRCKVSTLHQRFTFVRLHGSHLTRSLPRLFTRRSPPRLLTAAARVDLQPDSAIRLREAHSHLMHSSPCTQCAHFSGRCANPLYAGV